MVRNLQVYNPHPGFRENQEAIINRVLDAIDAGAKNIVLELPTGTGKSVIGYVIARYLAETRATNNPPRNRQGDPLPGRYPWRNYLMTAQNILLDQYEREFVTDESDTKVAIIKGGDNYTCPINQKSYNEGPCHSSGTEQSKLGCSSFCPYIKVRSRARAHKITLSNFHYMLLEFDHVGRMGKRDLAIFDECHNLESIMMDYRAIKIGSFLIAKLNRIVNSINNEDGPVWQAMRAHFGKIEAFDIRALVAGLIDDPKMTLADHESNIKAVESRIIEIGKRIAGIMVALDTVVKAEFENLESAGHSFEECAKLMEKRGFGIAKKNAIDLQRVISNFSTFSDDLKKARWVVDFEYDNLKKINGIQIKPLTVQFLTKEALLQMADVRIFMSATICGYDIFCANLGLDLNETVFIDAPSQFPTENRPFVYAPVAAMNYKTMEASLPKIVQYVDTILETHPNEKGIIHTVSFKNAQYLMQHSKYRHRFLTHSSKDKVDVLKTFYASKDKVFLSPSSTEGLDLKGDLSRFQIFLKVPYLSLGDKQIKARMELDPMWYAYKAVLTIVQGTGRSMRTEEDHCNTYMLDQNFKKLFFGNKTMFPKDFQKTVIWQ